MAKNQEVKAYLKLSDEALESAQLLYNNQKFRDCVSRAYYSMFYMTKALLCNTERPAHKHRGVIDQFNLYYVRPKKIDHKFYLRYVKAFEDRMIADYQVLEPILKELAKQKLQDAIEFRREILRVLKEEGRL
ncbi:MAG: hypothetical protein AMJ73_01445 [candidate division Zixibacteria bacterium SM1_73]|nr:MAG: hypothetical protein AMJ73_01445 [candidate division Zixibacteria bacterium SM1_73]